MSLDYYLHLDGIPGESTTPPYQGQIAITSFSFAGNTPQNSSGSGSGASGKVSLAPISFTKHEDSSSIPLFLALCQGTHIATALLTAVRAGAAEQIVLKLQLQEITVSSMATSASAASIDEVVSLTFRNLQ